MKHIKISIIGAGSVGSTIAYALMLKNIAAEIVLADIDEIRCRGEILDLSDALSFCGPSVIHGGTINEVKNSDIIVIAAGKKQEPGQDRTILLQVNKKIIESVIEQIKPLNQNSILIVVTNPVDVMTYYAQKASGLSYAQVLGSGTFLDTQRVRSILSKKIGIAEQSIHAYVLGEHGDTQFPVWSSARVAGIPLADFNLDKKELDQIAHDTKNKAYEIIACKGATYYGIAACVSALCRTIIFDQKRVTPLSCYLEKEDIYISLPTVLGAKGVEKILPIPMNSDEQNDFENSIRSISNLLR